jgi:hypothetical protein
LKDVEKAISIFSRTLTAVGDNYHLYIAYVNFLRHLDPSEHNSFVKMIEVCDKALANNSKLKIEQKKQLAKQYIEYLNENCSEMSYVTQK